MTSGSEASILVHVRGTPILLLILCATMPAQITHLATTSDGTVLYFSTGLQLNGGPSTPGQETYRYRDDTGTFEQCVPPASFGSSAGGNVAVGGSGNPDVTADGSLVAWNEFLSCTSTDFHQCLGLGFENPVGLITSSSDFTGKALWTGMGTYVQLSRNGKYAVGFQGPGSNVIFLPGGTSSTFPNIIYGASQTVSDTGAAVVSGSPPQFVSIDPAVPSASVPLRFSRRPAQVRLSRDGRRILYEFVESGSQAQLFFYDIMSGEEKLIATGPLVGINYSNRFPFYGFSFFPCFDDRGENALYVDSPSPDLPPQAYLWNVNDAPPGHPLTMESDGIAEAILSGSAGVAFASTLNNRLLRIDLLSGTVRELSGRVPVVNSWFSNAPNQASPGSLMQAKGTGLTDPAQGASVKIGDVDAPVLSGTPTQVTFQIPWETPVPNPDCAPQKLSFGPVTNPVFIGNTAIGICSIAPAFISPAIHQDFRGTVTEQDGAAAQEILHFYMIGLGPVSPVAQTGAITPITPLEKAGSASCTLEDSVGGFNTVTPSFVGLAPGLVGIYQLDLQVPALSAAPLMVFVSCTFQAHTASTSFVYR